MSGYNMCIPTGVSHDFILKQFANIVFTAVTRVIHRVMWGARKEEQIGKLQEWNALERRLVPARVLPS